jgi:hypothetical protein
MPHLGYGDRAQNLLDQILGIRMNTMPPPHGLSIPKNNITISAEMDMQEETSA